MVKGGKREERETWRHGHVSLRVVVKRYENSRGGVENVGVRKRVGPCFDSARGE